MEKFDCVCVYLCRLKGNNSSCKAVVVADSDVLIRSLGHGDITGSLLRQSVEILIARSLVYYKLQEQSCDLIYGVQSMPCTHACALSWHLQLSLERPSSS